MEEINKAAARTISQKLERAALEVGDELNLNVRVGGGTFDPEAGTFKPKVEFSLPDSADRQFRMDAPLFGVDPDARGMEFEYGGKAYTLEGFKPRSHKYPIIVKDVATGRSYKLGRSALARING